jgi:hypothetical protein
MNEFCRPESNNSPSWSFFDVFVWKLVPPKSVVGEAIFSSSKMHG